jgi:hypothetical protein
MIFVPTQIITQIIMASLIVPTTPVSHHALEATPSKKVGQKWLAYVNFTLFYL